jgi:transcriptional regulator with XRE-family HTH domain
MISNREVIDRIDSLLKSRNLKRNAVYDSCGLAHNTFSNWSREEGVKIPAQSLYAIAQFFNVSVEYLLTGTSENPPEVLNLAYEINALPDVYKKIVLDTVKTLKADVSEKAQEEQSSSGIA